MAIKLISAPRNGTQNEAIGPLPIPHEFDRTKFAAMWAKEGPDVEALAADQWIPGTQLTADGWLPWKNPEGRLHVVSLKSGKYVLLHRSKAVQEGVNAICGNVGKERLLQEKHGETTGGVPVNDPGMLSDDRLTKVIGKEDGDSDGDVKMNPVPGVERQRIETPALRTSSTRRLVRRPA